MEMYTHTVQRLHLLIEAKKEALAPNPKSKKAPFMPACNLVCTELSRKVDDSHVLFAPAYYGTFRSVHCDGDERQRRRAHPLECTFYPPHTSETLAMAPIFRLLICSLDPAPD